MENTTNTLFSLWTIVIKTEKLLSFSKTYSSNFFMRFKIICFQFWLWEDRLSYLQSTVVNLSLLIIVFFQMLRYSLYQLALVSEEIWYKVVLYKCNINPIWTYGIQLWGNACLANADHMQRQQSNILRVIVGDLWHISNVNISKELSVHYIIL